MKTEQLELMTLKEAEWASQYLKREIDIEYFLSRSIWQDKKVW